jgi:hypothetical protein
MIFVQLEDDRFKAIFTDSRFEVDKTEDAYRLLAPVVSRLDDSKKKKIAKEFVQVSSFSLFNRESVTTICDFVRFLMVLTMKVPTLILIWNLTTPASVRTMERIGRKT